MTSVAKHSRSKIAISADHNGRQLRSSLSRHLTDSGHEVTELGAQTEQRIDYPPLIADLASRIVSGEVDHGIMVGGTGSGESVAANKIAGIRAVLVSDHLTARIAKENNDANLLVLGAMVVGWRLANDLASVWVDARFRGGQHAARLEQIAALERGDSLLG